MSTDFYLDVSRRISALLTKRYSTSFSLGIRVFPREYQEAIYSVYGFVRLADEIVDTFHSADKVLLLTRFKEETYAALDAGLSTNPVLHAFQDVVRRYKIDRAYIQAFLYSMEMDIEKKTHGRQSYEQYIYGSAEVVGLMCLKVFCHDNEALFRELETPARQLGSAFQKVNFLRDIKSDLETRGRIYLPDVFRRADINNTAKEKIEAEIAAEFAAAETGIKRLPRPARLAVYSAFLYYQDLFKELRKRDVSALLAERIRVSNSRKLFLLAKAVLRMPFIQ